MKFQLSIFLIFNTAIFATLSQIFLKRISTGLHLPPTSNPITLTFYFLKDVALTTDFFLCGTFSVLAFVFSLLALRKYELTYYAPIVTGSFFLLVNLVSFYVLREKITLAKLAGSTLILLGIIILSTSR